MIITKYPPLVEDGYRYLKAQGFTGTINEAYQMMVEEGIINAFGYPTEEALASGLVKSYIEEADLTLPQFLAIYPVFRPYIRKYFKLIDGFWEINSAGRTFLLEGLANDLWQGSERLQVEAYLQDRL